MHCFNARIHTHLLHSANEAPPLALAGMVLGPVRLGGGVDELVGLVGVGGCLGGAASMRLGVGMFADHGCKTPHS